KAIFQPQKSGNKKTETGFCNMTLCPGSTLPVIREGGQNAPTERRFYKTGIEEINYFSKH
ncbi:hypothetical protein DXW29_23420, partial [Salmonella enterica]|nr:hypothetical protein [Salmonella enterica]